MHSALNLYLHSLLIFCFDFTIITLNYFGDRLPISTSLSFSSSLASSFGIYPSVISFYLIFCDCSFQSACCRVVVLFTSIVCFLFEKADLQGFVQVSWWEGLFFFVVVVVVVPHWWMELGLFSLVGKAVSRGVFSRQL